MRLTHQPFHEPMTSCQMTTELPVQPFCSISCGSRLMGHFVYQATACKWLMLFWFLWFNSAVHLHEDTYAGITLKIRPFLRFWQQWQGLLSSRMLHYVVGWKFTEFHMNMMPQCMLLVLATHFCEMYVRFYKTTHHHFLEGCNFQRQVTGCRVYW